MNKFGLTKKKGISIVQEMKQHLMRSNIPVTKVYLFGSLAKDEPDIWSDIDIAIIHHPFKNSRIEERRAIRKARTRFDVPMDIVCLHEEDLTIPYSGLVTEICENGVEV